MAVSPKRDAVLLQFLERFKAYALPLYDHTYNFHVVAGEHYVFTLQSATSTRHGCLLPLRFRYDRGRCN